MFAKSAHARVVRFHDSPPDRRLTADFADVRR
jgi:hypothetical protein